MVFEFTIFRSRRTVVMLAFSLLLISFTSLYFISGGIKSQAVPDPHENYARRASDIWSDCKVVPTSERVDCMPVKNVTEEECLALGCCWDRALARVKISPKPRCYFAKDSSRYAITSKEEREFGSALVLKNVNPSGFAHDVRNAKLTVSYCDDRRLHVKIIDLNNKRFEVPFPVTSHCNEPFPTSALYDVAVFNNGTLIIKRKTSDSIIFSTDLSILIFADQFLQLSVTLPSSYVYGLGDHFGPLLKDMNWTKYTFFNRDEIPKKDMNLYSSFPFYVVMEKDHNSHGVYFLNSNAMDVILQPAPAVTFRSVGGIFDFYVFMGSSPNEVVQQFVQLISLPAMPPYWSLGFHLCRLGYFTLNNTMEVLEKTIRAGIPLDVQWNDIDCMDRYNDFTYDKENFKGLPEFIDHLHQRGMHYALIVDPGISSAEPAGTYPPFDDGLAMDIFVKNASGDLLQTKVWNKVSSVFPDFTNPLTLQYWEKQLTAFHSVVPFDGVWLDMNEPTNFLNGSFFGCPADSSLEHPKYSPGIDELYTKTICMTSQHLISYHYNVHNLYGTFETEATYRALLKIRGKRPFILTRAGFPGIGSFAAMWNGDVISLWEHMQVTIPSLIGYSMAGIPMVGADICGFNDNTTVELCARWFALGAFYPFCRNHNSDENIAQDPVSLGPVVEDAARSVLTVRYFLLPHLYTLLYRSHVHGDTVMRPLFFEFPRDVKSYAIDRQFLWGPALMVIPALEPGIKSVDAYLPADVWYDFYFGNKYASSGQNFTFDAPLDKINLVLRGGFIFPGQEPSSTTTKSRLNRFVLLVALNPAGEARGELYWDDGETQDAYFHGAYNLIQFHAVQRKLASSVSNAGYVTEMRLGGIKLFGVDQKPDRVLVNGLSHPFTYQSDNQVLLLSNLNVDLLKPLTVQW